MRQPRANVVIMVLFLGVSIVGGWGQSYGAPSDQDQLRQTVQRFLDDNVIRTVRPSLAVQDDTLFFRTGGLIRQSAGSRVPIDYPLEGQFIVEGIRRHLSDLSTVVPGIPWPQLLAQAEQIIADELDIIRADKRTVDDMRMVLDRAHKAFFDLFERALREKTGGKQVFLDFPKPLAAFKVTVNTNPPGALVYCLPEIQAQVLTSLDVVSNVEYWHPMPARGAYLSGKFVFQARWAENQVKFSNVIDVREAMTVELSPNLGR